MVYVSVRVGVAQGWRQKGREGEKKTGIFSAGFLPLLERKNRSNLPTEKRL